MSSIIGVGQLSLTDLNDALVASVEPSSPHEGMLWLDSSKNPKLLKRRDGASWTIIGEIPEEGTGVLIEEVMGTIGNMANDNLLDYNERMIMKDKLTEILGYVIGDDISALPTHTALDGSKKGDFYSIRKQALNAGLLTADVSYISMATQYNNLKTYLDGLTPVKPWDLRTATQKQTISVVKATFRDKWLQYYTAVNALAEATTEKLKESLDNLEFGAGGRNFLKNSGFFLDLIDSKWKDNYFGNVKEIVDISAESPPFQFALHIKNTVNANGGIFTPVIFEDFVAESLVGRQLTLSFWLKYQDIVQGLNTSNLGRFGELEIEGTKSDGTKVYSYHRVGADNTFGNSYISGTNMVWNKYSSTIKIALPSGATKISKLSFKHGIEGCKGEFWTTGLKLETGDKATAWSADPLDIEGRVTNVEQKVLPDRIIQVITSSETYQQDLQSIEEKVAKLLTLSTSSNLMTFDENNNFKPVSQIIQITANTQNLAGTPTFTAIPYNSSGTQLTAFTLEGIGKTRTLRTTHWLSTYDRVVIEANLQGYIDSTTVVKVRDGVIGSSGGAGKDAIVGFLTNESITLPATASGVVSNFSNATGTFEVYQGITKRTGIEVTYAKTAESGCTASITTAGIYSVTDMTSDSATATFTATYGGVAVTKVLSLSKSKQGGTGSDGRGIASIVEQYYLSTSATTQTGGSWVNTSPAWIDGRYMWSRSTINYTSGSPTITDPINVTGGKGGTGQAGLGISKVDVWYYLSTSATALAGGTWATNAPTWQQGKFMWSKTITTYTNLTTTESNPTCISGSKGDTGQTGNTGEVGTGITSIIEEYNLSTSKTTANGSWTTTAPTWSSGMYVWTRSKIIYNNPTSISYTTEIVDNSWEAVNELEVGGRNLLIGSKNIGFLSSDDYSNFDGTHSDGVTTINIIKNSNFWNGFFFAGEHISDEDFFINEGKEYTCSIEINTQLSPSFVGDILFSIDTRYPPMYSPPATIGNTDGKWVKISTTLKVPNNPEDTDSLVVLYSTANFSVGDKIMIKNIKLERGNKATDYSPAPEDVQGQIDVSVKSTDVEYYLSTSATVLSGGSWLTIAPTWVNGRYMWSRTKIILNNGTTSYRPSATGTCIAGATGSQGLQGIQGPTGATGIKGETGVDGVSSYTHIAYATNATGTTGFSVSDPTNKTYIGMYVDTLPDDSTTPSKYKWTLIKGADGTQGTPGTKGADGQTPYLHIAWATNATGTTGFSTTVSAGKTYIGTYTDFVSADSSTASLYKWALIKGETGASGVSVTKVDVEYYMSTSATTQTGGAWSTTAPAWIDGRFMWSRTVITYSSGSPTYSNPAVITGGTGSTGGTGATGKGITSITEEYNLSTSKTVANGAWVTTAPTWSTGMYVWTRSKIIYNNPTSTAYTTEIVDNSWEAVNEIQIGGRNLALLTNTDNWEAYGSASISISNDNQKVIRATRLGTSNVFGISQKALARNMKLETGENYTLSFEIRGKTHLDMNYLYLMNLPAPNEPFPWVGNIPSETKYTKISTMRTYISSSPLSYLMISVNAVGVAGDWFEIRNIQLEKGNKATDWTPALEDIDGKIDGLVVGGRNLALNSNLGWTSTAYNIFQGRLSEDWVVGESYVITIKGTINSGQRFGIWRDTGSIGIGSMDYDAKKGLWIGYRSSMPETSQTEKNNFAVYNVASAGATLATIEWIKIEKGNMPTDYTPAPEDVQSDIDNKAPSDIVETLTTEFSNSLLDTAEEVTRVLREEIRDADGNIRSAYESGLEQTAQQFNISFTELTESLGSIDGEMTEVKSYFDFGAEGLNIGKSDSPLNITISNDQIDFVDNGISVAYINGKMMYIESLEVLSSLLVGNHQIEKYNSEITLIKYSG